MNDQDKLDGAARLRLALEALETDPSWNTLRDELVAEHIRMSDELVKDGSSWTEAQLRERLGELRGLQRIVTGPARARQRLEHLDKTLTARVKQNRDARSRAPTEVDDIDQQMASVSEWLVRNGVEATGG